ncbi:MAG TPA: hypothetical protein VI997_01550 [Candidatus Thermoplasmatota archaeon]|nr:hypothetical protein [Candidatus Thermoplasmatota archaeon]
MRLVLALVVVLLAAPLALAGTEGSDEFESGTGPGWVVLRETGADWNTAVCGGETDPSGCYLTISLREGDLVGATNDARNVFLRDAPPGDFRVTTALAFFPKATERAGLVVYVGDDDFFLLGVAHEDGARVAEAMIEVAGATIDRETEAFDWSPLWLRVERVDGQLSAFASFDGILWAPAGEGPVPAGALKVGLYAAKGHGPTASDDNDVVDASFGFFRMEAPPIGETHTEPPIVTISPTPTGGPVPLEVAFHATTSYSYPGLSWRFHPGDGGLPIDGAGIPADIEHTYTTAAVLDARLDVSNGLGYLASGQTGVVVGAAAAQVKTDEAISPTSSAAAGAGGASDAVAVVVAEIGSVEPLTLARGSVVVTAVGVEDPAATSIVAISPEGEASTIVDGAAAARWDTTDASDGWWTIEARETRASGSVVVASTSVLVRNDAVAPLAAAGAIAAGAAVAAGAAAAGSAASSRGFSMFGWLGDAGENLGEDVLRARTSELAALDRRRRVRSLVAAAVTLLISALTVAWAKVSVPTVPAYLAALPVFGAAAFLYGGAKHGADALLARRTGASTRFRLWIPGILALGVSTFAFGSPFGYPGYLRKEESARATERARRRVAGIRALGTLGLIAALILPFALAARVWRWDFGDFGVTLAVAAAGGSALPVRPLPGAALWRWNKGIALVVAAGLFAAYYAWQTAALPSLAFEVLGAAGLLSLVAVWATLRYPRDGSPDATVVEDEG